MSNVVYHYTSPEGILGILKDETLWFTDCQYLNDMGEILYIREPFKEAYEGVHKERNEPRESIDEFIDVFFKSPYEGTGISIQRNTETNQFMKGLETFRYYVLCASINPDTANMWNYYVKNGIYQGYNIGIRRDFINEQFSRYQNNQIEFIEGEVIYDRDTQTQMIKEKIRELSQKYDINFSKNDLESCNFLNFRAELYSYIHNQKLFFKNPAFSSEREHRFVLKVNNNFSKNNDLSVQFRVGASGIITPYIEWKYALGEKEKIKEKLFSQITLAPMIESNLAAESFKRFLATSIDKEIKIKQSSIKLRF